MKRLSFILAVLVIVFPLVASAEEVIRKGDLLTLERCVEIALKNHPGILAARSNVDLYYARKGLAEAGYYPKVDATAGYSRFKPSSTSTTSIGVLNRISTSHSFEQYSAGISANQTIYDFRKTGTQVNIQNLNIDSAREDLRNTGDQVIFNVKQAYYGVLKEKRNREVAGDTVSQFQQHLAQAKAFYEVGTKPKFDVTKAEVDLGNAQLNLIRANNNLKIARVILNNELGVPDAAEFEIEDSLSFQQYSMSFQEAIGKAYENRPELKSISFRKNAAEESVRLAKKEYYPVLTGTVSYSWAGEQFAVNDGGWSTGLTLSIPVFSGFSTKAQVAEAKANLLALTANEEVLRQSVLLEVQQSLLNLTEAGERIVVAELTVRQAQENFEIANGRYAAGVGNPIEVTDADVALSNAKTSYNQALYDYKIARASLEKAMGVR